MAVLSGPATAETDAGPDFGPFSPPQNFAHPEALRGDTPRPKPPGYTLSLDQRRLHQASLSLAVAAAGCLLFSFLPFVHTLSFYVLPLAYIDWIGYGLAALAAAIAIMRAVRLGPYAYIRDGTLAIARVISARQVTIPAGKTVHHAFAVEVEYPEPGTGRMVRAAGRSRTFGSPLKYTIALEPGDYTTVLAKPGPGADAGIYGLLDADPDHDVLRKHGRREVPMGVAKVMGITALVMVIIGFVLLGGYAFGFYLPEQASAAPLLVGIGVPAVLGGAALAWLTRKERAAAPDRVRRRNVVAFVGAVLGAVVGGVSTVALNAKLDRSAPAFADIKIVKVWQTTYEYVFRTYDFEYQPLGASASGTERYPATIDTINEFSDTRVGIVEHRSGAFGMPWIGGLHPCVVLPIDTSKPRPAHRLTIGVRPKGAGGAVKDLAIELGLWIQMPDGSLREPSNAVADLALKHIEVISNQP